MRDILLLIHRFPYPPLKGDKIRGWHVLQHLARTHRVHLGCFIDDPADWAHVGTVRAFCADLACFGVERRRQRLISLLRARPGMPLSVAYFQDSGLHRWVARKCAAGIDLAFVMSSGMAPYVARARGMRRVLDMADVDSEKWREYAERSTFPARLVWAREARTLLAFERKAAAEFEATLFVTENEAARFIELAPESRDRVGVMYMGVDLDSFAPGDFADPYAAGGPVFVFTGTMDYRPNIDAVAWFAKDVMPKLRLALPGSRFAIVGSNPTAAVSALAGPDVLVTGRVPDVRPYLAHATAAVAPLRIARGIQNKVLEAMAMGRPVVASPGAFQGVRAQAGTDLLVAGDAESFAECLSQLAAGAHAGLGARARAAIVASYAWPRVLAGLDGLLAGQPASAVLS